MKLRYVWSLRTSVRIKRAMESPATAKAMDFDGVERETVKMFVLDKEVKV
jgi:hypothetical protein